MQCSKAQATLVTWNHCRDRLDRRRREAELARGGEIGAITRDNPISRLLSEPQAEVRHRASCSVPAILRRDSTPLPSFVSERGTNNFRLRCPVTAARCSASVMEHHMLASFTTLAYAFCAAVLPAGATELVAVGYISLDRCFVQIETAESTIKVVDGHDILIEIIPDGAVVEVDALRYFIPKAPSV
jgi:hypothetical protein